MAILLTAGLSVTCTRTFYSEHPLDESDEKLVISRPISIQNFDYADYLELPQKTGVSRPPRASRTGRLKRGQAPIFPDSNLASNDV